MSQHQQQYPSAVIEEDAESAELELEIQREIEQEREDQFVLEQIELDDHKQEDWIGDKKV